MRHTRQHHSCRPQSGFTLLELLVVLVIIGILLTMASLSVGGGGEQRQLREEAERITALLALAADEAILKNRELLLSVEESGYTFLTQDEKGKWVPVDSTGSLRPRELPEGVSLSVVVEESLATPRQEGDEEEPGQIWILSSGEMTPFTLTLHIEDGADYQLHGDIIGNLTLDEPGVKK